MNRDMVDVKKREEIQKDTTRLVEKLSNSKRSTVGIKTRIMFKVMAGMQAAGWGLRRLKKEYWKNNGRLDKKMSMEGLIILLYTTN